MERLSNISYIFIPFIYKDQDKFNSLIDAFDDSDSWDKIHDEIVYMFKYVSEKMDSRDKKSCRCFHYQLSDFKREQVGLGIETEWFSTIKHTFENKDENILFRILKTHLFCFATGVGIISFQICFEKDNPYWISNALYYLKKVSNEKIFRNGSVGTTMLDISEELVSEFVQICDFDFFYYANPSAERSNVLTYLEVEKKEDYKKELFYLRRCYSEDYLYLEDAALEEREIYAPSGNIIWGVSPEAAVCLAGSSYGSEGFIHETYYKNFQTQYLFMYVLLLHQKYVLYMFLTKIGIGMYNDLKTLEEYRDQLYEFETDFVFSHITEVAQYQNLYSRMTQAFALKPMYEDVHEPLLSLAEVRRETAENEQKKRDSDVAGALQALSILSVFSALVDSFDFVQSFVGLFWSEALVRVIQVFCIVLIGIVFLNVSRKIRKHKK